jgi:anthranilate phosphoribosyltransferase
MAVIAFILAIAKNGKEREVLSRLLKFDEIEEAYNVYGDYDVLVKITAGDLDRLNDFIINKIRTIADISMTTTMIGL